MRSTHIVLESTPRLDELATSVELRGMKRVPTKEKDTTLDIYDMPEQCADMIKEIHSRKADMEAAIDWAEISTRVGLPQFFHLTSGVLKVKPNHMAVIKAVGDPAVLAEVKLRSWPSSQEESFTETKSLLGLFLIRPLDPTQTVYFALHDVDVLILMFRLAPRQMITPQHGTSD
ncbi:hypothetical protein DPSP01_012981 [Paraphaeosphaeria sporulosa]